MDATTFEGYSSDSFRIKASDLQSYLFEVFDLPN